MIVDEYCHLLPLLIIVLPPFQIVSRSGFSRYMPPATHLDIHYVWIHSKNYLYRKAKTTYNLEWRKYLCICIRFDGLNGMDLGFDVRSQILTLEIPHSIVGCGTLLLNFVFCDQELTCRCIA